MTDQSAPPSFRSLLRNPRVAAILAAVTIGRLAAGMVPFGMIAIYTSKHELGWAGASFAAFLIGAAVVGPYKGALVDRFGARRMLLPMAFGFAVVAAAAALLAQSGRPILYAVALALTATSAVLAPPNSAVLRTVWTEIARSDAENTRLHSLDSVVEEATFVVAPLLTSGIWLAVGAWWAVVVGGLCALAGTAWFRILISRLGADRTASGSRPKPGGDRMGLARLLLSRDGAALLLPMIALGVAMGALAVGYPAWALERSHAELAGVLIALDSVGGIVAGTIYGHLPERRPNLWVRYFAAILILAVGVMIVAVSDTIPVVVIGSLLVGASLTPMYIVAFVLVGSSFPSDRHTAVNASIGSAYNIGSGLASLAVGALLGAWSLTATLLLVAALTVVLGATALTGRSRSAPPANLPEPTPEPAPAPAAEADIM